MSQNSILAGGLPAAGWRGGLAFGLSLALSSGLAGCSSHQKAPRQLRAHTRVVQGIAHADPAVKAERYCSYCHGQGLGGGSHFEPTCYRCHGQTWLDAPAPASSAPADHTVEHQGFRHRPGLFQPAANCVACHGADLGGVTSSNTSLGVTNPGCELCHTRLWEQRAAPAGG